VTRPDPLAPPQGYGQAGRGSPHARTGDRFTTVDVNEDDRTCDVRDSENFGFSSRKCGKPGILRIWFGCPREHVGFIDACELHVTSAVNSFPCRCGNCQAAGQHGEHTLLKTAAL